MDKPTGSPEMALNAKARYSNMIWVADGSNGEGQTHPASHVRKYLDSGASVPCSV
jgi:L-rhamnose isomerase